MYHSQQPHRKVVLCDVTVTDSALGARVVRGTLWPTGEQFAATLWAVTARPGNDRQVVYTDRGGYRTDLDVYQFNATVFS